MSRVVLPLFRVLEWLWRRRIIRALLWGIAALWLLDGAVYFFTESQWLASLGMAELWRARVETQIALFGAFFGFCLLLTRLFLGAVTKISPHQAPPLRGSLSRFEMLRGGATRWAWVLALLLALFLSRDFARHHWSDALFARGGFGPNFTSFGVPAALWTHFLPLFAPFLGAMWSFSLGLFFIVAATGTLCALPLLAAREPLSSPILARILWRLGAWLLFLRALGYLVQIFDLNRGKPLHSGDVFISFPLWALGALSCVFVAVQALRRARGGNAPRKTTKLGLGIAAALLAPPIANFVLAPARAVIPETAWLRAHRIEATRRAWDLNIPEVASLPASIPIQQAWPVWDEKTLLQAQRGARFQNNQLVEWKSATLDFHDRRWSGLVAGEKVSATVWNSSREADKSTALSLHRLDLASKNALSRAPLEDSSGFFGLEGRALFTDEPIGVPIGSWGAKWLWAWRLRDLFLPFEGAKSSHLLVFRGAGERANRLAPFWKVAGPPQLVLEGENPVWLLPLCATTSHFPGAMSATGRALGGANAASDRVQMRLDARSGAVAFWSVPSQNRADFLLASWKNVLPSTLQSEVQVPPSLRDDIRAAPEVLRVQVGLKSALNFPDSGEELQILPAQHGFSAASGEVTRVAAIRKDGWLVVEAARGAAGPRILHRGQGDFAARLSAIDAEIAKIPRNNTPVEAGEPYLWPDVAAPGGWWIGRGFFTPPAPAASADADATVWRVALTGSEAGAPVSVADSASAALLGFTRPQREKSNSSQPAPLSLEMQALQAHEAVQSAGRKGDWTAFGRESARLKTILEKLAAQRANSPQNAPN